MENYLTIKDHMVVWTQPINQEIPVFFKHTNDYVSILYVKKLKSSTSCLPRNELINYINCYGLKYVTLIKFKKTQYRHCNICDRPNKRCDYNINAETNICNDCYYKEYVNIYYNHRTGHSNTFTDLVDSKIDITMHNQDNIYYHYRLTYKYNCFRYHSIIYQPWYHHVSSKQCIRCELNNPILNGYCECCLNYAYQISFKHVIIAWLSMKDDYIGDILCIIFKKLLRLLNYKVDKIKILTLYNPELKKLQLKNQILNDVNVVNDVNEDEKDLVTEDNMYHYVKFDLNDLSSEENYDDLYNDISDETNDDSYDNT